MFWRKAPIPLLDVSRLRQGLREASAWCALVVGDDPDATLWTPGLLDIDVAADEDAVWNTLSGAPDATVEALIVRRTARLAGCASASPERPDGRILVCEYDCSLFDGASRHAAPGFIDLWDIPAWDTWIGLIPAGVLRTAGIDRLPALLAWIPPPLIPRAHEAIAVNPCEVLSWLDTRDKSLARKLQAPA